MGIKPGWQRQAPSDDIPELEPVFENEADERTEAETEGLQLPAGRPLALVSAFVVLLLAVVVRLVHWTLFPTVSQASVMRNNTLAAEPMRGRIIDRNGLLLATDDFLGEVYARPSMIQTQTPLGPKIVMSTTLALGQPIETINARLAVTTPITVLTKNATIEQCDAIKQINQADMVWCDFSRERTYPQNSVAAHVLGFLNNEHRGLYGIEARYDAWLNSTLRWQGTVPSTAEPLPEDWRLYLPSPSGHDLALNLDLPLQYTIEKRLSEAVARYGAEAGTIIIMNPRSGAVLAMANYPSFDPNRFSDVADQNTWVNSAISAIYEPGSVFKLVTMAGGLDSGYITPDSPFVDEGSLEIGGRLIKNAEQRTYGPVTVQQALAHSINVVSAKVSLRMGPETFYSYVRQFGFGRLTEIDLQSEVSGIVKQPGRGTDWSQYDQAANSFGQGISVTAFQMINAVSAIANQGVLLQPQVVGAMVDKGMVHRIPSRVLARPIQPETALALTRMMVYTVESSSTPDPVPGYRVAGKTGTAEIPTREGYTSLETITSFIGFMPAADPQLVIMVKLDKPKSSWAEQVAVPVFAQVGQDAVQILEIKPDNRKP